jgi:hypothetical protein
VKFHSQVDISIFTYSRATFGTELETENKYVNCYEYYFKHLKFQNFFSKLSRVYIEPQPSTLSVPLPKREGGGLQQGGSQFVLLTKYQYDDEPKANSMDGNVGSVVQVITACTVFVGFQTNLFEEWCLLGCYAVWLL